MLTRIINAIPAIRRRVEAVNALIATATRRIEDETARLKLQAQVDALNAENKQLWETLFINGPGPATVDQLKQALYYLYWGCKSREGETLVLYSLLLLGEDVENPATTRERAEKLIAVQAPTPGPVKS